MLSQKNYEDIINLHDEESNTKDDNEDMIVIQLASIQIKIKFSHLCKYSQLIREDYLIKDARDKLGPIILKYQKEYEIKENNIILFFNLIKEENVKFNSSEYLDIYILSKLFKVNVLIQVLFKCIKSHSNDVSFILSLILKQNSVKIDPLFYNEISVFSEMNLTDKINECLQNEDFGQLPNSIVFRIFESRDKNDFSHDLLFDFIKKSIEKRYTLLQFLDVQKLSENKFNELKEIKDSSPSFYFEFLRIDLNYIVNLKENEKNQKIRIDSLITENQQFQANNKEIQSKIQKLENETSKLKEENQNLQEQINQINLKFQMFESKNVQLMNENQKLKSDYQKLENKIVQIQSETDSLLAELPFKEEFKGIIYYLSSKSDILNEINITSSSVSSGRIPQNVVLFNDIEKEFCTDSVKDSWLRIDFKKYRIMPNSYTLRSNKWGSRDPAYLTGWIIEGSNDNVTYEILDEQKNTSIIEGPCKTCTYQIKNPSNKKFKYLQVRVTKNTREGIYYLGLNAIEFNGFIFIHKIIQ